VLRPKRPGAGGAESIPCRRDLRVPAGRRNDRHRSLASRSKAYKLFIPYYRKPKMVNRPSVAASSSALPGTEKPTATAAKSKPTPAKAPRASAVAASTAVKENIAGKASAKKVRADSAPAPANKPATTKPAPKAKTSVPAAPESPKRTAADKPAKKPGKLRPKLVRDSFTMPEAEFALIAALKAKALDARRAAKKSELLRAGLRLLAGLDAKALVAALDQLEPVATGRPKKGN
jgi:hypothetical protein